MFVVHMYFYRYIYIYIRYIMFIGILYTYIFMYISIYPSIYLNGGFNNNGGSKPFLTHHFLTLDLKKNTESETGGSIYLSIYLSIWNLFQNEVPFSSLKVVKYSDSGTKSILRHSCIYIYLHHKYFQYPQYTSGRLQTKRMNPQLKPTGIENTFL